jgi:predicted nucleic acid-binding protein
MPSYFFDSSALVKRYVQELGTPRVLALIHSGQRLVAARLAIVELTAIWSDAHATADSRLKTWSWCWMPSISSCASYSRSWN